MPPFARIAFSLPLDQMFQYEAGLLVAEGLAPGDLVAAPFGHRTRPQIGCVVAIEDTLDAGLDPRRVRPLLHRATAGYCISDELRTLARWIASHYACTWGEALASVSLVGFNDVGKHADRWVSLIDPKAEVPARAAKQALVAEYLRETDNLPRTVAYLESACDVGSSVINAMIKAGRLKVEHRAPDRPDPYAASPPPDVPPPLTTDQSNALEPVLEALEAKRAETFLLYGITGSGKTEVYLRALAACLEQGRQAVILVPEIALTPQTVGRFRARFGPRVGVIHSRLSLGQKLDLWRRIERGEVDAVIGARSAVFAPLPRLGLIVVDEEHEGTYKQASPAPRYHARDVAIMRARKLGAVVLLGSATPSLESYHNSDRGKYHRLTLPNRIGRARLPTVELIDMADEVADTADPSPMSRRLRAALAERLERGEQSIVLLNRRGFAAFMRCPSCAHVIRCEHCDVAMTWHRDRGRLVCHWCEATQRKPKACPECEHPDLVAMGLGTQRIEEALQTDFPSARLLRIDLDTTRGKDAFLAHWKEITEGRVDIILGTQMIAKGLDLPGVTLVGVISADQTLFLPDFRASERAFQLMTQVAGRAGRAERPGEVMIQTYVPHHYALRFALEHDFESFFKKELHVRRVLHFPPAQRMVALLFTSPQEAKAASTAKRVGDICRTLTHLDSIHGKVTAVGPAPAPIARLSDRFRWRLLLRASSAKALHETLNLLRGELARHPLTRDAQMTIDVDPMDLM